MTQIGPIVNTYVRKSQGNCRIRPEQKCGAHADVKLALNVRDGAHIYLFLLVAIYFF